MHVYVHMWMVISLAFLSLMIKGSVSRAQGVYWAVANKWFMAEAEALFQVD